MSEDTPKPRRAPRKRKPAAKQPETRAAPTTSAPAEAPAAAPTALIRVPLSVRWRDLDAFNHVNNSKYLSYLEEARLRWMLSVPGQGLDEHVAPVVAAAHLNYRRPIEWPAEIAIELFVERLGATSVTIGHRIVDAADAEVLYCDGHVVMVWIDRGTGRAATLPEAVRQACSRGEPGN
ncbi:acyl-CoA thioesterase [Vulcaniibacterium tengchongense]|uniref:Acyl-CoA thioester hydrolase n=1 Tax=Vulcaniibacterium tengchongense TaxID=1273429 RepID=A0A3N4VT70_9GAMM|nr:thioesterase family protein [Vulcaniibacterium tengchongense]RPE77010.1 acyl-CoA thioester hydrolase [Vulcaniibacterium tengchongense]